MRVELQFGGFVAVEGRERRLSVAIDGGGAPVACGGHAAELTAAETVRLFLGFRAAIAAAGLADEVRAALRDAREREILKEEERP